MNTPTATKTTTWTTCNHKGDKDIWTYYSEHGSTDFVIANYGGSNDHATEIVLDLADNLKPRTFISSGPDEFLALNDWYKPSGAQIVKIEWPDYKIVPLPLEFWVKLLETLSVYKSVMITCVGGHGRSGTCLASLMVADGWSGIEAIRYIRKYHCSKAVETSAQEDYVVILSGEDPKVVFKSVSSEKPNPLVLPHLSCVKCKRPFKVASYVSDICQDCFDNIKQSEKTDILSLEQLMEQDEAWESSAFGNGLDANGWPVGYENL